MNLEKVKKIIITFHIANFGQIIGLHFEQKKMFWLTAHKAENIGNLNR